MVAPLLDKLSRVAGRPLHTLLEFPVQQLSLQGNQVVLGHPQVAWPQDLPSCNKEVQVDIQEIHHFLLQTIASHSNQAIATPHQAHKDLAALLL